MTETYDPQGDAQGAAENGGSAGNETQPTDGNGQQVARMRDMLPAAAEQIDRNFINSLPMPVRVYFDMPLYNQCKRVAVIMSNAVGFTPQHLIGKQEACFAVTTTAISMRLNPFFLAQGTYQTPGGQIGYMARVTQAIIEASGELDGLIRCDYEGNWDRVQGKFEARKSPKSGKDYFVPTWTREDAKGLRAIIRFRLKGVKDEVVFPFDLSDVGTLNATTWATEPKYQLRLLATRRAIMANRPSLLAGVPAYEDLLEDEARAAAARDITGEAALITGAPEAPPPVELGAEEIEGRGEHENPPGQGGTVREPAAADDDDDDDENEATAAGAPAEGEAEASAGTTAASPLKVGDLVQWRDADGVLKLPAPARIKSIKRYGDGRLFAVVEGGSATALAVDELVKVDEPATASLPAADQTSETAREPEQRAPKGGSRSRTRTATLFPERN